MHHYDVTICHNLGRALRPTGDNISSANIQRLELDKIHLKRIKRESSFMQNISNFPSGKPQENVVLPQDILEYYNILKRLMDKDSNKKYVEGMKKKLKIKGKIKNQKMLREKRNALKTSTTSSASLEKSEKLPSKVIHLFILLRDELNKYNDNLALIPLNEGSIARRFVQEVSKYVEDTDTSKANNKVDKISMEKPNEIKNVENVEYKRFKKLMPIPENEISSKPTLTPRTSTTKQSPVNSTSYKLETTKTSTMKVDINTPSKILLRTIYVSNKTVTKAQKIKSTSTLIRSVLTKPSSKTELQLLSTIPKTSTPAILKSMTLNDRKKTITLANINLTEPTTTALEQSQETHVNNSTTAVKHLPNSTITTPSFEQFMLELTSKQYQTTTSSVPPSFLIILSQQSSSSFPHVTTTLNTSTKIKHSISTKNKLKKKNRTTIASASGNTAQKLIFTVANTKISNYQEPATNENNILSSSTQPTTILKSLPNNHTTLATANYQFINERVKVPQSVKTEKQIENISFIGVDNDDLRPVFSKAEKENEEKFPELSNDPLVLTIANKDSNETSTLNGATPSTFSPKNQMKNSSIIEANSTNDTIMDDKSTDNTNKAETGITRHWNSSVLRTTSFFNKAGTKTTENINANTNVSINTTTVRHTSLYVNITIQRRLLFTPTTKVIPATKANATQAPRASTMSTKIFTTPLTKTKGKPDVYIQSKIEKILSGSEDIEEKYVPPNVILFLRYLSQKMKEHELAVENKEVCTY